MENGKDVCALSGAILRSGEIPRKNKAPLQAKACGGALLSYENHSLGEWFKRRLVPMMRTKKLLLL